MPTVARTFKSIPEPLILIVGLCYLGASLTLWLFVESTWAKVAYYVIFLLPNLAVGEYLAEKILKKAEPLSVSQAGFSIRRVLILLVLVLLPFAIAWICWFGL